MNPVEVPQAVSKLAHTLLILVNHTVTYPSIHLFLNFFQLINPSINHFHVHISEVAVEHSPVSAFVIETVMMMTIDDFKVDRARRQTHVLQQFIK